MISKSNIYLFCVILIFSILACTEKAENIPGSIKLNDKYYPPVVELNEVTTQRDSLLQLAKLALSRDSSSLENWIWYGRRMAYTHNYPKAIDIYSEAIKRFPSSPELLRHRGQRYITSRNFDSAIADLQKASDLAKGLPNTVEMDGLPNKLNIPLSNLHFNIWYHLGLAHYLNGDFPKAREVFKRCIYYSNNADLMVATIEWLYKTCSRLNDKTTAEQILKLVREDYEMIENDAYLDLVNLYKGKKTKEELNSAINKNKSLTLDQITVAYGVGNQRICEGDTSGAKKMFEKIVDSNYWPAFGYIAAEADLAKLQNK
jgi:tetratricopeptide (TPR) repeat protein